jgi:hypothetical protein
MRPQGSEPNDGPLPDLTRRALFATGTVDGMPRFLRLLYQITGTFTQGTLTHAGLFPTAARAICPSSSASDRSARE